MSPSFDQLSLQVGRRGRQHPVARFALHAVAEVHQALFGVTGGIGPERGTETFVGALVTIHELANRLVLRVVG